MGILAINLLLGFRVGYVWWILVTNWFLGFILGYIWWMLCTTILEYNIFGECCEQLF